MSSCAPVIRWVTWQQMAVDGWKDMPPSILDQQQSYHLKISLSPDVSLSHLLTYGSISARCSKTGDPGRQSCIHFVCVCVCVTLYEFYMEEQLCKVSQVYFQSNIHVSFRYQHASTLNKLHSNYWLSHNIPVLATSANILFLIVLSCSPQQKSCT